MTIQYGELAVVPYSAEGLHERKEAVLTVYREVYAEWLDDPFFTPERFWERLEAYSFRDGFQLVTGRVGDELVGFSLGETLPAKSGWWRGFRGDADPDLLRETGMRTFAINELMVRPAWRRRGYAKALTYALLADRPEERATLLVRAENTAAYTAYLSWGFMTIGQVKPFDDSPVYEAMVRPLPVE
jgi:ribosomal protein S18 acetylase RimI-like enzyme